MEEIKTRNTIGTLRVLNIEGQEPNMVYLSEIITMWFSYNKMNALYEAGFLRVSDETYFEFLILWDIILEEIFYEMSIDPWCPKDTLRKCHKARFWYLHGLIRQMRGFDF